MENKSEREVTGNYLQIFIAFGAAKMTRSYDG